jgi:hypothetical protein
MTGKANPKLRYRGFFLALQSDCKAFPGGIAALAELIGMNGKTLANQLNPDYLEALPTLATLLELVGLADAKRPVFFMAQLIGQTTMPIQIQHHGRKEAVQLFLAVMKKTAGVIGTGSEAAADLWFDAAEADAMEGLLLELIQSCGELLISLRSD